MDGAFVVVKAVVVAVLGVEIDLNRDHKIHGCHKGCHIGQQHRNIIPESMSHTLIILALPKALIPTPPTIQNPCSTLL